MVMTENMLKKVFEQVASMARVCVFSAKYNPRAPDVRKIFKKHSSILKKIELC